MRDYAAPLAVAVMLQGTVACNEDDNKKPAVPKSRSQAVAATSDPGAAASPKPIAKAVAERPTPRNKKLCDGQLEGAGSAMTDKPISRAQAAGADPMPEDIPVGDGRWTWLNFWAAWCVPCKEEMPRLRAWEKKRATAGDAFRLVFVSIDDDPRQLDGFLKDQGPAGVRSTYWLKEGRERTDWLEAMGLDPDPELPVHALVDPKGNVRCRIQGAVEDGDYDQAVAVLSRK